MKNRIRNYVDNLFSDIYETKQLNELKEEVSANLLEKINDLVANGSNQEEAFQKAIAELGDVSELVESMKKDEIKEVYNMFKEEPMDKKHVMGYLIATAIILFGIMAAGVQYLESGNIKTTIATLLPFIVPSVALYVYFGLTQENIYVYAMNKKRALSYSLATAVLLFGVISAAVVYFEAKKLSEVLSTLIPFVIPSVLAYMYLGLTEKSRIKENSGLEQHIQYYSNPRSLMLRGNISGALWIFSTAVFFIIGFVWGWKFSWIVFLFATGMEVVIEGVFASRRN
jgi:hypothetical protein